MAKFFLILFTQVCLGAGDVGIGKCRERESFEHTTGGTTDERRNEENQSECVKTRYGGKGSEHLKSTSWCASRRKQKQKKKILRHLKAHRTSQGELLSSDPGAYFNCQFFYTLSLLCKEITG